tara:strand:- start:2048 stop:8605 length:6558 start_codon:yes stop_codon:yes gene_type:complete
MKNPIFKDGIKSGIHRLGGAGEIKRIRLRDIHSPQRSVDEKKVAALARFTKNMPGTPTVSHAGRGKYVLKDGNHRVNAALRQGKRVIDVRVQQLSSYSPLIQFMHCTAESVPRVDLKRKIVKKRINTDPIRRLSSSLDGILNFTTGKYMNKFLPGTMWGEDEQHVTTDGRVMTKPTIAKQIYKTSVKMVDPKDSDGNSIVKTMDRYRPDPTDPKVHILGKYKTVLDPSADRGERDIRSGEKGKFDRLNTRGYRSIKVQQLRHEHAAELHRGYSPSEMEGKGLSQIQQDLLGRGLAGAKTQEDRDMVVAADKKVRTSLISGDLKPEMLNVRSAIARDVEINRRLVHAIRKAPGGQNFLSNKIKSSFGPGADKKTAQNEAKILASTRANFDEHLAGETLRRKGLAARLHENVFKRSQRALVAQKHGADWESKLTQRDKDRALQEQVVHAKRYADTIKTNSEPSGILDHTTGAPVEHPHGALANLIGAKPETIERFRIHHNNLETGDFKTNRKVENDIIKSGKIFDNKDVFTAPEAVKTDLKKFPTLKKIGIAGAVLGGGALAYHLYNKRKKGQEQQQEPEPQKMLMSRRGRIIQFGKKIPKLPFGNKLSEIIPKDILKAGQKAEVTRLINKKEGVASATEAAMQHVPEARIPGHEAGGDATQSIAKAAEAFSPQSLQQVSGVKRAIVRAAKKPQGIKKLTPAQVFGDELAASAKPTAIESLKQHLSNTQRRVEPVAGRGGRVTKLLGLKPDMASVAGNDVVGVMEGFAKKIPSSVPGKFRGKKPLTPEQALRTIQTKRPILASQARELRNKLRGFKRDNGESFDAVQTRLRAEALTAQNAAQEATIRAEKEIAYNQNANHEALKNQASSMREAREKALTGQASGHKKAIEDTKSKGWRNTAIGTGAGLIGGALVAGNASRQTYQPKKQLHQPERKLLMSSRRKIIRFERNDDVRKKSTLGHDIATGALEGGIIGPFTEPLYSKLREGKWGAHGGTWGHNVMPGGPLASKGWGKFGKNAAIGAGLGAATTALVGAGVNVMDKKRRERLKKDGKAILFKAITPSPRGAIARDKYDNAVFDQDETKSERNYKRAALASGGLAILLRGKRTRLGTFVAGAGAGIGAQAVTRSVTAASKDQFGDRSHLAKRIDRLPWQVPALIAGGIIGKRAWKAGALKMSSKGKLIQFYTTDDMDSALRAQKDDDRLWRKAKSQTNNIVQGTKRGTRLSQDLLRAVKGQKNLDSRGRERKREWEKPWVRNVVTGTLMAGTAYGFHKIVRSSGPGTSLGRAREMWHQNKFHDYARNKVPGFAKVHDWVKGFKGDTTNEVASAANKSGMLGKMLDKVEKGAGGPSGIPAVTHANIKAAPASTGAPSAPAVDMAKATIENDKVMHRKLNQIQKEGAQFKPYIVKKELSSKVKSIRFDDHASLDDYAEEHGKKSKKYRDAHEKWLRLQPGKRQRDRRDATFGETKSGMQLIYRAKLAAGVLGGALGARLLGKRMDAGYLSAAAAKGPRRNIHGMLAQEIAASSRDPLITLNSRLTRLLQFEEDHSGIGIGAAAGGIGAGVYALMRRRAPLPKTASAALVRARAAADAGGLTSVVIHERKPSRLKKAVIGAMMPSDSYRHIIAGRKYSVKKTKAAVFDPSELGFLEGEVIGARTKEAKRMIRDKQAEYDIATKAGLRMPHTAPLEHVSKLNKGYIAKLKSGSQTRYVVTHDMIKGHDPKHPLLSEHKAFRKHVKATMPDFDAAASALNSHPGYKRWLVDQAVRHPNKFVQQQKIDIAKEYRVHVMDGKSLSINSGRHGVIKGVLGGANKEASIAAEKLLKNVHPSVKGNMMAMDLAKDKKGAWHVIETNTGADSGFLSHSPASMGDMLDFRGPHQLYKRITGRYAKSAAAAGGIAAAGVTAGIGSRHDQKRLSARGAVVRFSEKEGRGNALRNTAIVAGLGTAALGASFSRATNPLFRIAARKRLAKVPGLAHSENAAGHFVSDYIEASTGLRSGLRGKFVGHALKTALKNPSGMAGRAVGGRTQARHLDEFTSGGMRAVNHWEKEANHELDKRFKGIAKRSPKLAERSNEKLAQTKTRLASGSASARGAINHLVRHAGMTEDQAIRRVATGGIGMVKSATGTSELVHNHPDTQEFFRHLAKDKSEAAEGWVKAAHIAPTLTAAGVGISGAALLSGNDKRKPRALT